MFLQEPKPTGYDLKFRLLNIPVMVHPFFWIVGLVIVGQSAIGNFGDADPGNPLVTLAANMVMWFVSILIHEMGHSLMFAYYGIRSRICLYALGGMAIPENFGGGRSRFHNWQDVHISLAGPFAQLIFYFLACLAFIPMGYLLRFQPWFVACSLGANVEQEFVSQLMGVNLPRFLWAFWVVNFFLPLFNLLPIYPLDGGQVLKEVLNKKYGYKGMEYTLWITVATSAFLAITLFQFGNGLGGLLVAMLGLQAFQMLQQQNRF